MNFSVYYQVYKNKNKTEYVLSKFREHHPNEKIYLISDGGDNFNDIAKRFDCNYVYSDTNLGYFDHNHPLVIEHRKNNLNGGHPYGWTKDESDIYLKRFYDCCNSFNTEFILLLEDDVIINSKIDIEKITGDITFSNSNNKFLNEVKTFLKQNDIDFNIFGWGMCGGNFIRRKKYIEGFEKTWKKLYTVYDDFYKNHCQHIGWQDVLFSMILSETGAEIQVNPFYSEYDISCSILHDRNHRK